MPTATEQLTKVEDQIIDTMAGFQRSVVEAVRTLAEKAGDRTPDLTGRGRDVLPVVEQLVASQFAFAERVLATQREFVDGLLDAVRPAVAEAPEPAATATTKTAKGAKTAA